MTAEQVLDVVREAVATVLERDPAGITARTRLREDLQADSLALAEIAEIVQSRLAPSAPAGFAVDDGDLAALVSVGDAVEYALARL